MWPLAPNDAHHSAVLILLLGGTRGERHGEQIEREQVLPKPLWAVVRPELCAKKRPEGTAPPPWLPLAASRASVVGDYKPWAVADQGAMPPCFL
jgi:hypothetical protein